MTRDRINSFLTRHPALASFLRVLGACAAAAYATLGKVSPLDLTAADARAFGAALVSALVLTGVNWLRSGDTRFGRGTATDQPAAPPAVTDPAPPPAVSEPTSTDALPPAPAVGD